MPICTRVRRPKVRGIAGHFEQAERGTIRKSPQAHKHFCPLLPTAMVFVSYWFVLVQVQVQVPLIPLSIEKTLRRLGLVLCLFFHLLALEHWYKARSARCSQKQVPWRSVGRSWTVTPMAQLFTLATYSTHFLPGPNRNCTKLHELRNKAKENYQLSFSRFHLWRRTGGT
jgi:hypothetical protein